MEASKLRQKAEDLVKDNKMLIGSSSLEDLVETGGRRCEAHGRGITRWLRILSLGEGKGCARDFNEAPL